MQLGSSIAIAQCATSHPGEEGMVPSPQRWGIQSPTNERRKHVEGWASKSGFNRLHDLAINYRGLNLGKNALMT